MFIRPLLVLAAIATSAASFAADSIVVDVQDGLIFGSSRIRSMGGAYTSIAEGAGGHLLNPASLANRPRYYVASKVGLGLDFGYAQSMIRYAAPNLSTEQKKQSDPALPAYSGFVSSHVQINQHGIGGTAKTQGYTFNESPGSELLINHHQFAIGYATGLFDNQILVGALGTLHVGTVTRYSFAQAEPSQRALLPSANIGVLAHPTEEISVGWTLAPSVQLSLNSDLENEEQPISLKQPFSSSVGISHHREWEVKVNGKYRDRRTLTVAADIAFLGAANDAYSSLHLQRGFGFSTGGDASLSLRLGAESEIVPGWLRLRAGTYTEPARYELETTKLHATTGLHLRVFSLPSNLRWALVGVVDIAPDYIDTSIGIGFW